MINKSGMKVCTVNKPIVCKSLWIVLTGLVILFSYALLDKHITHYVYAYRMHERIPGLYYFSSIGKNVVVFAVITLALLYFRYLRRSNVREWAAWYVLSCAVLANIIGLLFKILFGRARPMEWIDHNIYGFYGPQFEEQFWSFPSGHSLSVMSVVFAMCYVKPAHRWWFLGAGLLLIASRVLLMRHYLSDIIAASLIGYLVSWMMYKNYFKSKIDAIDSYKSQ